MGRDLYKYTKVQLVLYRIFEIVVFVLGCIILINSITSNRYLLSDLIGLLALLASVLIICNSRLVNSVRLIYLLLYFYEAWQYEHYVDALIKLLVLVPMAAYVLIKTYMKRTKIEWTNFVKKEVYKRTRSESKYTVLSFGLFIGVLSFILTKMFNQYVEAFDDHTLSSLFFTFLTVSGFMFGWYNKNQSIVKWPYGLVYHTLVFYMWSRTSHNFAMDIYCIFWVIYTILGCIEAYYLREFDLGNPSIFILDLNMVKKHKSNE